LGTPLKPGVYLKEILMHSKKNIKIYTKNTKKKYKKEKKKKKKA